MEHRGRLFTKWRVAAAALMLVAFAGLFACGEATDQPEDCLPGEFFDEANEDCTPCPALAVPDCREGCGFRILDDERGCPVAECGLTDQSEDSKRTCLCATGEFFSEDTFSCQSCEQAESPPAICAEQ